MSIALDFRDDVDKGADLCTGRLIDGLISAVERAESGCSCGCVEEPPSPGAEYRENVLKGEL